MPKLLVANWKENPSTEKKALALFRATAKIKPPKGTAIAVCPPVLYLEKIVDLRRRLRARHIALGAQDVFWEEAGAYTSAVGPRMLRSLSMQYVLIGHSERRRWAQETDAAINKKLKRALAAGLKVILCVGEGLKVRRRGMAAARRFVSAQLQKDLRALRWAPQQLAIAYEPIWAIGTGRNARAVEVVQMAEFIKSIVKKRNKGRVPGVLYGGSVTGKNARDYVQYKSIDGALVGGASLRPAEFQKIAAAAGVKNKNN